MTSTGRPSAGRTPDAGDYSEPAPDGHAHWAAGMMALEGWFVLAVALVSALGLAAEALGGVLPFAVIEYFSLSHDANLPTFVSSSLLLACCVLAGSVARHATRARRHWWGIAAIFGYASIDEATELHMRLGDLIGDVALHYVSWTMAFAFVVVVLVMYLRFIVSLPRVTRTGLTAAAILHLISGVGAKVPVDWWTELLTPASIAHVVVDWVAETLRMIGALVALLVLLRHRVRLANAD